MKIDTYSFGEVVDKLRLRQLAIKVVGGFGIGQRIYIDPKDGVMKYFEHKPKPITLKHYSDQDIESKYIIIDY